MTMLLLLGLLYLTSAYDPELSKHCVNLAQSSYCVSSPDQWDCLTCESSIQLST